MSEYGVQPDGTFNKKPIDAIKDDLEQEFKNNIGTDIELRPSSPIQQDINSTATEIARMWDAAEAAYYASYYKDSFGEQLDKQLALAGFRRKSLRGATGEVTFSTDTAPNSDVTIPSGTVVTTEETESQPAIPFETTVDAVIDSGTTEVTGVPIEALNPWQTELDEQWLGEATNVSADTITKFGSPVSGVDSVTNPEPTGDETLGYTPGRDEETDPEFKLRYERELASQGTATRDSIRSGVFDIDPDVKDVFVEEIRNPDTDEYGVKVTVLAPNVTNDQIAQGIYDSRAAGLKSFGADSGTADTDSGGTQIENFERATAFDVAAEINITTDSTFASDGQTAIRDRIIRYIGGTDSEGDTYPGLGVGENVVFDQVFRRILNEQGVVEATLSLGPKGGTLDTDNVTIASLESSRIASGDITFL